jgi:hypothetical protein
MICAPVVMLAGLAGWMGRPALSGRLAIGAKAVGWGLGSLFMAAAIWSSVVPLIASPVGPDPSASELASIREIVDGQRTLYLIPDNFSNWKLRGARLTPATVYSVGGEAGLPVNPAKPAPPPGGAYDFDSVDPAGLDAYRFAVLSRTAFASTPPSNWHLAKTTTHYLLYERKGLTPPRNVAEAPSVVGVALDCADRAVRKLAAGSVAAIRPEPVLTPPTSWRTAEGGAVPIDPQGYAFVAERKSMAQSLPLSRGRWDLSVQYQSPVDLEISAPGLKATLPARLDARGAFWSAGTIVSTGGPAPVVVTLADHGPIGDTRFGFLGHLAATRVPVRIKHVKGVAACKQFADWFSPR